jgi:elongation factor Ts
MVTIDQIKKLREATGISISECKKALEAANCDPEKAKEVLRKWGRNLAEKKELRSAEQGIVDSYIHPNKKMGVILLLKCESDFVAKSEEFKNLAHELCLQFTAMGAEADGRSAQVWIKDSSKTVKDLIDEYVAKVGEKIAIGDVIRLEV